ncbi:MAG: hypothetical protein ACLT0Y_04705 [Christensenellales bacterium]
MGMTFGKRPIRQRADSFDPGGADGAGNVEYRQNKEQFDKRGTQFAARVGVDEQPGALLLQRNVRHDGGFNAAGRRFALHVLPVLARIGGFHEGKTSKIR